MTPEPNLTVVEGPDGTRSVQIHGRGMAVLDDPQVNRGTAFTMDERDHLGLHGLLPSGLETITEQVARCYEQFRQADSDVAKWVFLTQLHDSNEVLFYRLVGEHVAEMLPIVYTPTVGTAIQEFSHLFRRPRGVFLNVEDVDGIDRALDATGLGADDIDLVVASDAEAILGIGDWGVGGIDISIGKLAVYTVAAGIDPARVLAVGLDVGTNRESLLNDPRYLGLRRSRVRGEAYDTFIDAYVAAASKRFPKAILHWEDFSGPPARGILARYGDTLCTFDDDIQGTAAVGLACALAGVRVSGGRLVDQQIVVFGAGSAGVGIADLIALAMTEDGLSAEEAADRIYLLDRPGLLTTDMTDLYDYQQPYAKDPARVADWRAADGTLGLQEVVDHLHPTMLVGTSGVTGAFGEKVIRVDARELCSADHPAHVQPDRAGRADADEPAGLDGRRRAGGDRQPLRAGRAGRYDVPDRAGQQRPDVPGAGTGSHRVPCGDDASFAVHRGGASAREAGQPDGPGPGPAAGHLATARGVRHGGRGRHQRRHCPGHRPGQGRRPDRGGARSDVDPRVPTHRALTGAPRT